MVIYPFVTLAFGVVLNVAEDKAHLVVLSGVFYRDASDNLMVADDDLGALAVGPQLAECVDKSVAFVAHHCPPDPPDSSRWGGGSCLLEGAGHCHAGHHERPSWLYEQSEGGSLQKDVWGWWLLKPNGDRVKLFLPFLVGHYGQIVITALPNLDKLREDLANEMKNPTIEGVQAKIAQMQGLLSMLNREKDNL